ncbi:hypothetical protein M9458_000989 [Cirrhinus mrigala]|uniref:RNase H type-1 domain-containing protein n=1 Tax=Cirrhinus mrigala TaxID=683832 RepID=A0ABD0RX94_CIRMR
MPQVEETLKKPALPTKPCRLTSSLVGKAFQEAGQAGAALHIMGVLQAYQADLLKDLNTGGSISEEVFLELCRATDLSLRATKQTARSEPPLAQYQELMLRHRDVVLAHLRSLGLRLNAKKSVLSPAQRTTYLGVVWDSITMQAQLSPAWVESILNTLKNIKLGQKVTLHYFQRVLGLMAAASMVIPLGLLHMRQFQLWLRARGYYPRANPQRQIRVTRQGLRTLSIRFRPWFLTLGPTLGPCCRRKMLMTDASLMGWGVVLNGRPAQGIWRGHLLDWHINCLEMMAVFRALKYFLQQLGGYHVLVRVDNTAVVSYINRQGGLWSRRLNRLVQQILLWAQDKFLSLRAIYIPGHMNMGADFLSRQAVTHGEWKLHPEVVSHIWERFYEAEVDLFASQETAQCPLYFSLTPPAPLGLDTMAHMWPDCVCTLFPRLRCSRESWPRSINRGLASY